MQSVIVFMLVSASVLLSLWWLTPARRRLWVLDRLVSPSATRGPLVRLRRSLLARAALGCNACKANPNVDAKRSTQKAAGLPR